MIGSYILLFSFVIPLIKRNNSLFWLLPAFTIETKFWGFMDMGYYGTIPFSPLVFLYLIILFFIFNKKRIPNEIKNENYYKIYLLFLLFIIIQLIVSFTKHGEIFNVACGKNYSLMDLIGLLNRYLGSNFKPTFTRERKGDVRHSLADIEKAKLELKYKIKYTFEEGLKKTIKYFLDTN